MQRRRVLWTLVVALCLGGTLGSGTPAAAASRWRWPLDGVPTVTRRFDPPATPYGRGHRGVDLAAAPGAVVRTAGPGVVSYTGTLARRGVVAVRHADGLRTTYEPVAAAVRVGDRVAAGAQLGTVQAGHSGCPSAACLHWGLLRGGTYLDPLSLLGLGPVRLLPLDGATPGTATTKQGRATAAPGLAGQIGGLVLIVGPPWWLVSRRPRSVGGGSVPGGDRPPFRPGGVPAGRPGAAGRR